MIKKIITFIIWQMGLMVLFAQQKTQLIIHVSVLSPEDSLELFVQSERIANASKSPSKISFAENRKGTFYFNIEDVNDRAWLGMRISFQQLDENFTSTIFDEFLVESGDSIVINLSPKKGVFRAVEEGYKGKIPVLLENWNAKFSGKGAAKFEVQWEMKNLNGYTNRQKLLADKKDVNALTMLEMFAAIEKESIELIESYKGKITKDVAVLLLAQQKGVLRYDMGRTFEGIIHDQKGKETDEEIVVLKEKFLALAKKDLQSASDIEAQAARFIDYLTQYTWVFFLDQYKPGGEVVKDWYYLTKNLTGPSLARDRVLASLLMRRFQDDPQRDLLDDALSSIQDPFTLNQSSLLSTLLPGERGYAFSLPDANGKYHRAEDYKEKVVFMDFWYASCGPCKQYMKDVVRPIKMLYRDNPDVVFITVSADGLALFKSMLKYDDFLPEGGVHLYTDGQGFKHPIIKHYQIQSYPYPLLIGKDGKLLTGKFNLSKIEGLKQGIDWALAK